jgi:penicillin-binding protein 1A
LLGLTVLTVLIVGVAGFLTYKRLEPNLPDIDALADVELHLPLSVYTSDAKLIAEFGEKRREQLLIEDTPQILIDAVIASEDDRFYEHPGVDYQGLIRAGINLLKTGRKGQGGSTITMQVARNIYLSPEKTYVRKINEILLALKIERQIGKDEILELYLNIPYLGNRAYGAASAARVYYGKAVAELDLAEAAMIAGLPKAPSLYNPIVNPERALVRRNYVLRRMVELGKITDSEYQTARNQPVTARLHRAATELEAEYVSEMARAQMIEWLGDEAYTGGYKVYTTIDSNHQIAANKALRKALQSYEQRHGFRLPGRASEEDAESQESVDEILASLPGYGGLEAAMVLDAGEQIASVQLQGGKVVDIPWSNMVWASPMTEDDDEVRQFSTPAELLNPLDLIYIHEITEVAAPPEVKEGEEAPLLPVPGYALAQMPDVEGALVALAPQTGKIIALVGGFDFYRSKFNRATQAYRQPGSNFKPFVYSAALEHGDTAASIYNDTPIVLEDNVLEDEWRPRNYSGRFFGPTRLREALVKSRNLVSIRVLQELGIPRTIRYAKRFGFDDRSLPKNLSLVLGSGDMTPLQLASGYTVFANNGYSVPTRYIERIEDAEGRVIYSAAEVAFCDTDEACEQLSQGAVTNTESVDQPAGEENPEAMVPGVPEAPQIIAAPRVIDARNAFIMRSIMREVIQRGTATRAKVLGRSDIAGKTGTTNDLFDAWFTGFNSSLVATAWIGYDEQRSLGPRESGGVAALPMWVDYMQVALNGVEEDREYQPEGIATARIDRKTGKLASPGARNAYFEFFRTENLPTEYAEPQQQAAPVVVQESRSTVLINGDGNEVEITETPVVIQPQVTTKETTKKKIEQLF